MTGKTLDKRRFDGQRGLPFFGEWNRQLNGACSRGIWSLVAAFIFVCSGAVFAQAPAPDVPVATPVSPSAYGGTPIPIPTSVPASGSGVSASTPAAAATSGGSGGEPRVKVSAADSPIERVASTLASQTGKNVVAHGKTLGQRVTLIVRDQPLESVLTQIVAQKPDWLWTKSEDQPNTYEIWDQATFKTDVLPTRVRQKVFLPREITAEEAYKAIQGVLTPNIGAASFDPRSNKVIVTDLPYVLELVQRLIDQIDVKFITRVFYIAHADIQSIAEKIANLKSPAAPQADIDPRTHQIIVRDRIDVLRQMELLIETLDVGPEMRSYDLNNIGFEGQDRQDLEEAIQAVITPDAFFRINNQSGKLLLQDVPEVHEKVEKILAAFDQPAKQVLIQAEVVETEFSEGFNYQIDYTFSDDLFSSVIDKLAGQGTGTAGSVVPTGVPTGSLGLNPSNLGFIDFRKEFPIVSGGSTGLTGAALSHHAFVMLKTAMSDTRTRILQQPRAIVKNQKEVTFHVGQKVPFFTGGVVGYQTSTNGTVTNSPALPQQNLIEVGLDLNIRPVINNNGLVDMEVEIRNNSAFTVTRKFASQDYDAIGTNNQELQSTLIIPSGETRVIGGLVSESRQDIKSGIPGLIKIPVLGPLLFGSYKKPEDQNKRRNLLLFLTPTIVLEKPADLHKYKGRIIVDENAVDTFTSPTRTLSDVQCEPLPIVPPDMVPTFKTGDGPITNLPPIKLMPPPETDRVEIKKTTNELEPPQPTVIPVEDNEPPVGETTELKRISINDTSTTSPDMIARRMSGPSGALTGASPTGGRTGTSTGTGPTFGGTVTGGARVPPGGTVATPGVFGSPPGTSTSGTPAPTPVPTPVLTPVPTPVATPVPTPPTETRF